MRASHTLKRTADLLTLIRFVGVLVVPLVGLAEGPSAVAGTGGWLLLLLWMTDLFDGQLARRSGLAGEGRLAELDGWADLLLALSGFTLLTITGFVSPLVWAVVTLATLVLVRVDFLVFQGIASFFLSVFYFWTAIRQDSTFLVLLAAFLGIHALLSRERFVFLWNRFWGHVWLR
ncbi:hypothetical protein GTO10_01550 [Candidatus Saccharibacteria bacterium]|nr:hypothetical protein [Candidatus Saccharibacteria bacterium]